MKQNLWPMECPPLSAVAYWLKLVKLHIVYITLFFILYFAHAFMSVWAQSTLGARHFCLKIIYEKLTKEQYFSWYLPENVRILHDNCPKNIFPILGACPHLLRLCMPSLWNKDFHNRPTISTVKYRGTFFDTDTRPIASADGERGREWCE